MAEAKREKENETTYIGERIRYGREKHDAITLHAVVLCVPTIIELLLSRTWRGVGARVGIVRIVLCRRRRMLHFATGVRWAVRVIQVQTGNMCTCGNRLTGRKVPSLLSLEP